MSQEPRWRMVHLRGGEKTRVGEPGVGHCPAARCARWGAAGWFVTLLALVVGMLAGPARAQVDDAQFRRDLAFIGQRVRTIGSPGYEQTAQYLRDEIKKLGPAVELREQTYSVLVPETRSATLTFEGGTVAKVYPFWPAHVRVNATEPEGIRGRLVYVGKADFKTIQPRAVAGQIAVMESDAGTSWRRASYFGARAIIVLGRDVKRTAGGTVDAVEGTNNAELRAQELQVPVNIPRFYIPDGPLAEALRTGRGVDLDKPVVLKSQVNWVSKTARNLYAYVDSPLLKRVNDLPLAAQWAMGQAATLAPAGWTGSRTPGVLMFSVPFDSSGLVPDLAVGASQAVQTASGLALLRDAARHPLDRPVMVFFGGADSIQFLATRNMFMALADSPATWRQPLADLAAARAALEADLHRAQASRGHPERLDPAKDRELIDRIVKIIETDGIQQQDALFRIRLKNKADWTDAETRRHDELVAEQVRLNRLKYSFQTNPPELAEGVNPNGETKAHELGAYYIDRVIQRMEKLIEQNEDRRRELSGRVRLYEWLAGRLHRTAYPDERTNNARLIELLVGLDFSDHGLRAGPLYYGQFQRSSTISNIQEFHDWFSKLESGFRAKTPASAWFGAVQGRVDLEPLSGVRDPRSWLCASMPIASELCPGWGIPGFSWITLDDLRLLRDTPNDTLANLNVEAILPQLHAVRRVMWKAWNDPKFKGPVELRWNRTAFTGQVVSAAAGRPVPDLPRPGYLATYYYVYSLTGKSLWLTNPPYTMGIRRDEMRQCDAEGNYFFEGLPKFGPLYQVGVQVYKVSPDTGAITSTSDMAQQATTGKTRIDIRQDDIKLRSLVFDCKEFSLVGLYDPRFLQNLGELILLDARRNAEPQRYNYVLSDQLMAGFIEPDMRSFLIFRYGRVGNRMTLINMPDPAKYKDPASVDGRAAARGYTIQQLNDLGPLSVVAARDFMRLDGLDLKKYARAGVSNELLNRLQAQSHEELDAARTALAANDGDGVVRDSNAAQANQTRVYDAAQDMASDVVHAAIFLLLLCVPFSFCMERLIIGSTSIYKQLVWTFVIFGFMTLLLWSFHPAFKISSSPLIIILAFAIIFMSLVVISVVYGRFDTELKRIRSGRGSAATASFARASVLMSAVLLGIANMRKRKFRTALTSITIVLITFAVLCFTSASQYLETTTIATGVATAYPGLELRQRGFRPMPDVVIGNLHATLDKRFAAHKGPWLAERWWNVDAGTPTLQIHVVADGPRHWPAGSGPRVDSDEAAGDPNRPRLFPAQAILGITPGEAATTPGLKQVLSRFNQFTSDTQHICFLSRPIAEQLQVDAGDTVRIGGIPLKVLEVFDPHEFDRQALTLSGDPLAPLKYSGELDAGGKKLNDNSLEALDLDPEGSAAEAAGAYEHLSSTQFVIVPAGISQMLPNAALRSIGLRLDITRPQLEALSLETLRRLAGEEQVAHAAALEKPKLIDELLQRKANGSLRDEPAISQALVTSVSDDLARRFAIVMFAGFNDGVKMVSSGSGLPQVSGASQVAIPLAIAGLIIFNTMMGSIAERKREIHVYTSLGLAPLHVGALFVAEALTYGLIGTVFGYIGGQFTGYLLLKLGWLGSVTLNYSGTSAMLTMGLILLIVLLSALVPARLASQIAAPSIERSWKVPLPQGDQIIAQLPFTINKTAADGALAYLAEFFDAHREGSIGKFSSGKIEPFTFEDESQASSRGLKTVIWLTPFDLGVRQHLMLLIHPGQYKDIYEVQVVLQRLSGDDGSWYRMNRSFLTQLRKQFLQWRSLTPQRMLEYVEESHELFANPTTELVTTAAGEDVRLA